MAPFMFLILALVLTLAIPTINLGVFLPLTYRFDFLRKGVKLGCAALAGICVHHYVWKALSYTYVRGVLIPLETSYLLAIAAIYLVTCWPLGYQWTRRVIASVSFVALVLYLVASASAGHILI